MTGLALVLIIIGAYLAAHVAFEWLARRYLVVSGAEYLLLGMLLGPRVSGVLNADVVGGFAPFMVLALGWIGAVVGAQFHVRSLITIPATAYHTAVLEALLSFAVMGGAATVGLSALFGLPLEAAVMPGAALGAIGTATAPAGVALAARSLGRRNPLIRQLELTTAVDAAAAVAVFWILLSIGRASAVAGRPTATEWAVIAAAIGVVGGGLFNLFLGGERERDRLFVGLAGAIILTSGAAAWLGLSPLLPCLLIGAILVNTSRHPEDVSAVLAHVERPLYFVLLIFAGAAWDLPAGPWWVAVLLFPALRAVAKPGAAALAARAQGVHETLGSGWGQGLLGHGGLAVALALDYLLVPDGVLRDVVFTVTLVSVLLTDLGSARLVRELAHGWTGRRSAAEIAASSAAEAHEPAEGA